MMEQIFKIQYAISSAGTGVADKVRNRSFGLKNLPNDSLVREPLDFLIRDIITDYGICLYSFIPAYVNEEYIDKISEKTNYMEWLASVICNKIRTKLAPIIFNIDEELNLKIRPTSSKSINGTKTDTLSKSGSNTKTNTDNSTSRLDRSETSNNKYMSENSPLNATLGDIVTPNMKDITVDTDTTNHTITDTSSKSENGSFSESGNNTIDTSETEDTSNPFYDERYFIVLQKYSLYDKIEAIIRSVIYELNCSI